MELHDEIEYITQDALGGLGDPCGLAACATIAVFAKESAKTHGGNLYKKILAAVDDKTKEHLGKINVAPILNNPDPLINKWAFINFVTIYEAWIIDILRAILRKYPQKLKKGDIDSSIIIDSTSREECLGKLIEKELIDILYDGPKEVTKRLQKITSIDIENIPERAEVFRLKAVRDILLHNKGIVNKTYLRKSGDTKATEGVTIEIDSQALFKSFRTLEVFITKVSDELVKKYKNKK